MEETIQLIYEYKNLVKRIKKDFKRIYNPRGDINEMLSKGVSYLEEKILEIKELKGKFSKQKEELESNVMGLEGQIEFLESMGEKDVLKSNFLGIKKFYLDIYSNVEKNTDEMIHYFDSAVKDMKEVLNNGEIKTAMSYLKQVSRRLR